MSKKDLKPTNIRDGKRIAVMHGECWIMPVKELPDRSAIKSKNYIIGHSETQHHHVLVSDTPYDVMEEGEKHDLYVKLFAPAEVVHQKTFDIHETQVIAPGAYVIFHKQEYDPFADVVRAVYD